MSLLSRWLIIQCRAVDICGLCKVVEVVHKLELLVSHTSVYSHTQAQFSLPVFFAFSYHSFQSGFDYFQGEWQLHRIKFCRKLGLPSEPLRAPLFTIVLDGLLLQWVTCQTVDLPQIILPHWKTISQPRCSLRLKHFLYHLSYPTSALSFSFLGTLFLKSHLYTICHASKGIGWRPKSTHPSSILVQVFFI